MEEEKVKKILDSYNEIIENIRQALREAGVPETLILYYTINLPDLKKLLPENVLKFYEEVKIMTIMYLDSLGFSHREISKRIGGHSNVSVGTILKEHRPKVVSPEEVKNSDK